MVLASIIALVVAEVVVRVLGVAPGFGAVPFGENRTSDDPELLWELNPASPGINPHGLRGPPVESPKSRERVLVVGDSIAYGIYLDLAETIPVRLAERLAERGRGAEVLNAGVAGYNTTQEARSLERLAPELRPDHVVLIFCLNDLEPLTGIPEGVARHANREGAAAALAKVHASQRWSPTRRALVKHSHFMRMLLESRLTITGKGDRDKVAAGVPLRVVEEGFDRIERTRARWGFGVTVAVCPRFVHPQREQDRAIRAAVVRLARERAFDVLDLHPGVSADLQANPRSCSLPGDSIHPNAEGADLIARIIAEHLTFVGAAPRQDGGESDAAGRR